MKILMTFVTLMFVTTLAAAEPPSSLLARLPKLENKNIELTTGAFLTKSANLDGLKFQYQEGNLQPNWATLSTNKADLTEGPIRISAAPRMMLNRDGLTGYGAELSVNINGALDVSHSAQFGQLTRQTTSAQLAPGKLLSVKMSRSVAGQDDPITRLGPVFNLGRTNLSYEHGLNGATYQVLMTSNLSF